MDLVSYLESNDAIERVADPIRKSVTQLMARRRVRDVLSGVGLGHPTHPALVTIPIGAWTSALVADVVRDRQAARLLTGVGIVAAIPAVAAGLSDWVDTAGAEMRVGAAHLAVNGAAAGIFVTSFLARARGRHLRGAALGVVGTAVLGVGGWLGGHLSYGLGVGVDTNAFEGGPTDWTRVDEGEHDPGASIWSGSASGVGLVMVTDGGGVVLDGDRGFHVLANRCSHRGGPLSEGRVHGGCLECPWHGSQFDVKTGRVATGPAVVAQPVYEWRRSAGGIEVRRDEPRALRTNSARG